MAFCCVFFFNANGTGIAKALRGSQFSGCKAKGAMLKTTPKLKNCHFCISSWKNSWAFFFPLFFFGGKACGMSITSSIIQSPCVVFFGDTDNGRPFAEFN